jgi:hypothetical protein
MSALEGLASIPSGRNLRTAKEDAEILVRKIRERSDAMGISLLGDDD